ncbi:MAG: MFS transporter [Planctomycetes bacterium]|nr:MFS transporter [Planctomycetota bacterium]
MSHPVDRDPAGLDPGSVYQQRIEAGRTRNFRVILGVHTFWSFGSTFFSHLALIPVFLQELGASNLVIGTLPALVTLFMFGPQVLAAHLTSHLPVKKRVFASIHYPGCAAILVLGVLTQLWGRTDRRALIAATLVCLAAHSLSLSFAMPMWSNLVAKLFPPERRGRDIGRIFFVGGLTGGLGALLSRELSRRFEFPIGYTLGFLLASLVLTAAVTAFFFLDEPAHPDPGPKRKLGAFFRSLWGDLRGQRGYQFYLLSQVFCALSSMAFPFYAVAARELHGLGVEVGATFTAVMLLSRVVGSPLAGLIGDRLGFRALAFAPPLLTALAGLLALLVRHPGVYHAIFILGGLAAAADTLAIINLPMEFSPHADKTSFVAARGTLVSPVLAVAPMIGGYLADTFSGRFALPFAGSVLFGLLGVVVLAAFVREPRRRESAQT